MKFGPETQTNYECKRSKYDIGGSHTCSPTHMKKYKRLELYSS